MKFFLSLLLMSGLLLADNELRIFLEAYKSGDSSQACDSGRKLFRSHMRDENLLIAIGHACSEEDFIDFVGVLQQRLGQTPESRNAAVYFSTLVLEKRLIAQYMHAETNLDLYALPVTDHILSRVYEAIKNKDFTLVSETPKHLHIGNAEDYLDVYIQDKMYVDVYKNSQKIKKHRYR